MKRLLLLSGLILAWPGLGRAATQDRGVIGGTVGPIPPNIDASNPRNFTNNGTINGGFGFRFDTAPNTGPRRWFCSDGVSIQYWEQQVLSGNGETSTAHTK